MIEFSPNVTDFLSRDYTEAFHLINFWGYYSTSHSADILMDDGNTYISDGIVESIAAPKVTSSVDKNIYSITIADPKILLGSLFEESIVGKVIDVKIGFIHPDTGVVVTAMVDTLNVYRGKVHGSSYTYNTAEIGDVKAKIECSSPMGNLDGVSSFRTSRDFMAAHSPDDNSFEQIYLGSGAVTLKWGRS